MHLQVSKSAVRFAIAARGLVAGELRLLQVGVALRQRRCSAAAVLQGEGVGKNCNPAIASLQTLAFFRGFASCNGPNWRCGVAVAFHMLGFQNNLSLQHFNSTVSVALQQPFNFPVFQMRGAAAERQERWNVSISDACRAASPPACRTQNPQQLAQLQRRSSCYTHPAQLRSPVTILTDQNA
jgi:hypothetical protein